MATQNPPSASTEAGLSPRNPILSQSVARRFNVDRIDDIDIIRPLNPVAVTSTIEAKDFY